MSLTELPLLTADLPGTGGEVCEVEDFVVEEIAAYTPCGEGEHCMALVRKRGLTTLEAGRNICKVLGVSPRNMGYAGMKDKKGVTTQWLSFQGTSPEELLAVQLPGLQVLEADRHKNKLRTGHLRGNRFTVVLHDTAEDGLSRAQAVLDVLQSQGLPNFYGPQRFGRRGDNAEQGLRILRKERRMPRDRRQGRLLLSSVQSLLFNDVVTRRLREGSLRRLLGGEVLQRTDSGGPFISEDAAVDGPRLERGEVVITGPMHGSRMPWPKDGSPARALEQEELDRRGVAIELFASAGRQARGGRRPVTVPLQGVALEPCPEVQGLKLQFSLPSGTYATVLLAEVIKEGNKEQGTRNKEQGTRNREC